MNAATQQSPDPRRPVWPGTLALLLVCGLSLVAKSPDALTNPQFWAEDGTIFFQQQQSHVLPLLLTPYAGYLHLLPRLVAWLASWGPLPLAPVIYCMAAFAINTLCVGYFLLSLAPWRLALVAYGGIFLTPTSGEFFGSLSNCQWFVQLFLVAACFAPVSPCGRCRSAVLSILVLVAALTGPFALLLALLHGALVAAARFGRLPLPALKALAEAEGRYRLTALWLGAGVQASVLAFNKGVSATADSPRLILEALGAWTQGHLIGAEVLPSMLFLAALALLLAAIAWLGRVRGTALFLFVLMSLALLEIAAASGKLNGNGMSIDAGDRYFFLFKIAFWMLAYELARTPWAGRLGLHAAVAALLIANALWHSGRLQRKPLADKQWSQAVAPVERGQTVKVPINPTPWSVVVQPDRRFK